MMDDATLAAFATKGLVLTANKRLAATLTERFDRFMALTMACWEKPAILPLGVWLSARGSELGVGASMLSDVQERRLWEEIIEADIRRAGSSALLQVPATAETAAAAHKLLLQYRCEPGPETGCDDVEAFRRWRGQCQSRCRQEQWHVQAQLSALVAEGVRKGSLSAPGRLTLAGFDLLPPDLQDLLDACREQGCEVLVLEKVAGKAAVPAILSAADPEDEARRCAVWARSLLEAHPGCRIGIVAPSLGEYLAPLRSSLEAELAPIQCFEFSGVHPAEFSLGEPLAGQGPVQMALALFGLGNRVELAIAGWLLRSPFLGKALSEAGERALADFEIRRKGQSVIPLSRFGKLVRESGQAPEFQKILKHLLVWGADCRLRRPGLWSERMADLLEAVGWPGEGRLDSRTYQVVEKVSEVLQRLASLDLVSKPIGRQTAVALLRKMAQETEFQVEELPSTVQVIGMLEAGGQQFDALWLLGMHDGAFPAPARPNPFLPLRLQKELGMPHADASRELDFAWRTCQRLFASAGEVVVSWPSMIDGAECRPSPLLVGLREAEPFGGASCDPRQVMLAAPLESWQDACGPGIPAGIPFKGGTGILKDQALCPFRAFAHFRLLAEGLETPDIGLDPMSRGTLVHGVLEAFWTRNVDQERLLALTDADLKKELSLCAEQAVNDFEKRERHGLPKRQRAIEISRLQRVAATWLEHERRRGPFAVAATEQNRTITIGGLAIRTRIDRIDQLPNGQQLFIDYKTGRPDVANWLDERVTEPQLPVYCYDMPREQVGGVLFARVHCREKESGFYGLLHPGNAWSEKWGRELERILTAHGWEDFSAILDHWQGALETLAKGFLAGRAEVDPVDIEQACRFCDLLPFCRRLEYDLNLWEDGND